MSELIDRQAVIDLLKQMRKDGDMVPWEGKAVFARIRKLPTIQPEKAQLSREGTTKDATSDLISKFIDGLEEIFADLRERHVDDSVCGLCEYDGAYMGQSGDWCNECPGFDRDDCFKLSDETRRKWTAEIIKALPTIQPERQKGEWIDYTEDGYVECPFCHSATNCDGNKDELHFCFSCGADMRGEQDG